MSEQSGIPGVGPGGTGGGVGTVTLVDQGNLGPRTAEGRGVFGGAAPTLRFLYGLVSKNFGALLLVLIVASIFGTFVQGGATLMGNQIKNALVLGAIYALVAIGYTMVYGIIELINFAHGDVFTVSGFYAVFIANTLHLNQLATSSGGGLLLALVIVFPLSMLAAGLTGMAIEFVAYRRLRDAPRLAPLITAIGVSFLIEGVMLVREGPDNVPRARLHGSMERPSPWERSVSGTPISSWSAPHSS